MAEATPKHDIVLQTYLFNQHWLTFADAKAAAVLTIDGVLMGFMLPTGDIIQKISGCPFAMLATIYVIYVVLAVTAGLMSVFAIYPRGEARGGDTARVLHSAGVAKHFFGPQHTAAYVEEFKKYTADELLDQYVALLHRDFLVAIVKYRYVKRAIVSLFTSAAFALALIMMRIFLL